MSDFDPEKFEEKYVHYFNELQRAYKNAFNRLNEQYDSELIHAIDQQILNESEPFYEGDGEFRVELPDDPVDRVEGIVVADEKVAEMLDIYVEEIETELRRVFGFESGGEE
ncbi:MULTISPECIES: DUF5783 family protein [Halorussus]|uniref:DUF5783 family protein n=1 Tax=Halorussus TaxID=1070314 RepID=UPI000E20F996|nr:MULTISPECIES: DUF5783 family protein [Halorussus]NHN60652.1 hypothetical protein [Halorussus sp. JP-T4]